MGSGLGPLGGTSLGQMITQRSPFLQALSGLGGSGPLDTTYPTADATAMGAQPDLIQRRRDAIAGIESAGSGDYAAVGTPHATLGRPLGRYQIMEGNLPKWSQEALGRRVTADEFLRDPKLQDAVFDHRFGQYASKYGEEGAARAWLGGEGSVARPDRTDVHGTSVGEYGARYTAALGADRRQEAAYQQNPGRILRYANQKAQRNDPLDPALENNLQRAVADVFGPGYSVEVYSGGQENNTDKGTGSTRHNHGLAADVYVVGPDGKRLSGDKLAPLAQYWQYQGWGGVGLEMAGGGIHLDNHADRARAWDYGTRTPGQMAAITAGQRGEAPALYGGRSASRVASGMPYSQQMAQRMFGGSGGMPDITPGQGEQRAAALRAASRMAAGRRGGGGGGGGVQAQQAQAAGGGGVTSNREELLYGARQRIASLRSSRNERRERRKQELRMKSRGQNDASN